MSGRSTPTTPGQPSGTPQPSEYLYVTHGTDNAVSAFRVDGNTGILTEVSGSPFSAATTTSRVQALCLSGSSCDSISRPVVADPSGRFLYVIDPEQNGVRGFQIDAATGALVSISKLAFDTGDSPQDVRIDPSGRFLYVDSNSPGGITAFTVDANTGALRSVAGSPFSVPELPFLMSATNCCLYLASTDQPGGVMGYRIDSNSGSLKQISGSPFGVGQSTLAVAVDASGNYVLAVDNTGNGVVAFKSDPATGALSPVGAPSPVGDNPLMIAATAQGFAYVSTGEGINGYALNSATGALIPVSGNVLSSGAGALAADTSGKFVFAVDMSNNTIVSFAIDPGGALRQVSATAPGAVDYVNMAVATAK